jgi:hypothetical protein
MRAEEALEDLREQVERAVINSYELTRKSRSTRKFVQRLMLTRREAHMGQLLFEIDIEHYQGPEDFYPINPPPLEGIDITVEMPDGTPRPGISINLQE